MCACGCVRASIRVFCIPAGSVGCLGHHGGCVGASGRSVGDPGWSVEHLGVGVGVGVCGVSVPTVAGRLQSLALSSISEFLSEFMASQCGVLGCAQDGGDPLLPQRHVSGAPYLKFRKAQYRNTRFFWMVSALSCCSVCKEREFRVQLQVSRGPPQPQASHTCGSFSRADPWLCPLPTQRPSALGLPGRA